MSTTPTIIAGQDFPNGIAALPPRFYEDKPGVWITELTYEGKQAAMYALAGAFKGKRTIEHKEGPFWRLTITIQGLQLDPSVPVDPNSQITTIYELDSAIIEKDIWQLPKVALALDSIADTATRLRFRADVEALARGELSTVDPANPSRTIPLNVASINALLTNAGVVFPGTLLNDLLQSFGKGVNSYPLSSFVLRKTQIAPAEATVIPQFYGSNQIWTTRTLLSQESAMPASISGAIGQFLSQGYWLKNAPKVAQRSDERTGARVEIATEWTYADSYSTFIFGQAL